MLTNIQFPETYEYKSGSKYPPIHFFLNALLESNRLDLLLGYFSTSAINVLSLGFAAFIAGGGVVRLVINEYLSSSDKKIVLHGLNSNAETFGFDIKNITKIKDSLSENNQHFMECVAWMIASKRITIQAIKPKEGFGISHYKSGIFSDGENKIKFKGSCNFTYSGLVENLEELDIKPSWKADERVFIEYENYFDEIINGRNEDVTLVDSESILEVFQSFGDKDLDELLDDEKKLIKSSKKTKIYKQIEDVISKAEEKILTIQQTPRFPYSDGPRQYQSEAYKKWIVNSKQGIFSMATGTGKTLTSLNCLLNEYEITGSYKAIVVVPTIALVTQWKSECEKFNFNNIITISSKDKWEETISFFITANRFISTNYVLIVTYASFHRKKFQEHFKRLDNETLLIADEAHNLGSGKVAKLLPHIHLKKRIGLSATPNRKYDEEGNQVTQEFFNDKAPYIVNYDMKRALDKGWLCQYEYFPHLVELQESELSDYVDLSRRLMKFFDSSTGNYKKDPKVEMLLLARKRIIHKAANKLATFSQILKSEYRKRGNLSYTLIYVPEGVDPNYEENDYSELTDEDAKLIHAYTRAVSDIDFSIRVKQFTSNSTDRQDTLRNFENEKLHVLTSMKCLDEGVDIPRAELAIFCSSTGNPRQFIQRRGRVLRLHDDKTLATIHDLVVIPTIGTNETYFQMERTLVRKELERVVDFSFLAINKNHSYEVFEELLDYYDLNLNDIHQETVNQTL